MAKTYAQIQAQIRKLQQEAETLKAKEVAGVVARIQDAITHYGLKPADLFGTAPAAPRGKSAVRRAGKVAKGARAAKPAKPPAPAKYQDDAGHQWSGIGKRPNWFKAALAAGKTADELRVIPPTTA
jgi:DNA-binding protein H-NS